MEEIAFLFLVGGLNTDLANVTVTTIIQISLEEQISTYCIIVSHGQ